MATLYEYYNTGDDGFFNNRAGDAAGNLGNWGAKTFTPTISHRILSVKLKLFRVSTPGTVTVSIRATDGSGVPTGSDLASGTTDGDTLTTNEAGEWREITLGDGYYLVAGTKYAILHRSPADVTHTKSSNWRADTTSPTYSGGSYFESDDAGVFLEQLTDDCMFEEYDGGEIVGTTTALTLVDRLSQSIGDYIKEVVTTNIAANAYIVSTHLNKWDGGADRAFDNWWIHIASQNNEDRERRIRTYASANATANVYGGNLTADTNVADIRVGRYSYAEKLRAINDAVREVFPVLFRPVVNTTIISSTNTFEYNLPTNLALGELRKVFMQENTTNAIAEQSWGLVYGWRYLDDGTTKKFRLPFNPTNAITFRLEGFAPFSILVGPTNSVETSDEGQLSLLIAYAKYKLYQTYEQPVASLDTARYRSQSSEAYGEYIRLKMTAGMMMPAGTMHLGGI